MNFPSKEMSEWLSFIFNLINEKTGRNGEVCIGQVHSLIEDFPPEKQKSIISELTWSVIIDQQFNYVLVDGAVEFDVDNETTDLQEEKFYNYYYKFYSFPKLKEHLTVHHISPYYIKEEYVMEKQYINIIPDNDYLLKDKEKYWGEISDWLCSMGLNKLRDCFIAAFKIDKEFGYLFEKDDTPVTAIEVERKNRIWLFEGSRKKDEILGPWYDNYDRRNKK